MSMRRTLGCVSGIAFGMLMLASPASAQVVQSIQVGGGWFFPRGEDSRVVGDVLVANLTNKGTIPGYSDALLFDIGDFRSGNVVGEWNVTFGDRVEIGASLGYSSQSVPSVYQDFENANGFEIRQELKLRIVPVMGIVRFMPFGRAGTVQPYVGAGLGALNFRYSEAGEFVDPSNLDIFEARYTATGTTLGTALLGGVKLPLGGDIYGLNIEYRYQFGSGNTGGASNGFLDEKIDLSGGTFNFTFQVRF
jgi:hypothetical protein